MAGYFMVHPESKTSENLSSISFSEDTNAYRDYIINKLNIGNSTDVVVVNNKISADASKDIFIVDSANAKIYNISIDIEDSDYSIVDYFTSSLLYDSENSTFRLFVNNRSANHFRYSIDDGEFNESLANNKLFNLNNVPNQNIGVEIKQLRSPEYRFLDSCELIADNSFNNNYDLFNSFKLNNLLSDNKNNIMKLLQSSSIISAIVLMLIGVYGMYLIASKK
jgi:hypothetical protein